MRSRILATVVALATAGLVGAALPPVHSAGARARGNNDVRRGLSIAPVPLNLRGKNRTLVGRGSYLVNAAADCVGCHTEPTYLPGGNPFRGEPERINVANYLAGGAQFGPFRSRNITPDAQGNPAGLTLPQFLEVMRTGHDLKNLHPQISPLLQVMPWPAYSKMTDRDLRAIYEYLRSVPHAEPPAPPAPQAH